MTYSGNANRKCEGLFVFLSPAQGNAEPEIIMTTLNAPPLALLLRRLFEEDESSSPLSVPALTKLSGDERDRLMGSKKEYRELYGHLKDMPLAVSRETGALLYMLARSTGARSIVEFGTSFGVSTLHLAAALRDNGGGRLITTEFEPSKVARARENLAAGGLADLVEFREGDALETLNADLPETIDLLLLDGAKPLYSEVLSRVENRLRPGALLVADNANHSPEYIERVRQRAEGYISIPFSNDVELSMRLG
jgi:predicted O-methyltransferase YrrM